MANRRQDVHTPQEMEHVGEAITNTEGNVVYTVI